MTSEASLCMSGADLQLAFTQSITIPSLSPHNFTIIITHWDPGNPHSCAWEKKLQKLLSAFFLLSESLEGKIPVFAKSPLHSSNKIKLPIKIPIQNQIKELINRKKPTNKTTHKVLPNFASGSFLSNQSFIQLVADNRFEIFYGHDSILWTSTALLRLPWYSVTF